MTPTEVRPLLERLGSVRAQLLEATWQEQEARETLERVRFNARQALLDEQGGDVKRFGPNAEAQKAAIDAHLAEDQLVMDCLESLRIATREKERNELALALLIDERKSYENQTARMAAVAGLNGKGWE